MTSSPWASATRGGVVVAVVVDQQRPVGGVDGDLGHDVGDRARGVVGRQHERDGGRPAAVVQQRLGRALDVGAVGDDHALVVEREAQRGAVGQRAGQPLQRPLHGPEALGQARCPAPRREGAHERDVGGDHQPAGGEQLAQGRARQQARVGGHVAPPAPARQARRHARTGSGVTTHRTPPERSSAAQRCTRADRVVEVLEHVGEHDDVEARVVGEVLDAAARARRGPAPRGHGAPPSATARGRPSRSRASAPRRAAARARSRRRAGVRAGTCAAIRSSRWPAVARRPASSPR